jgi:hypothetical protein
VITGEAGSTTDNVTTEVSVSVALVSNEVAKFVFCSEIVRIFNNCDRFEILRQF